MSSADTSSTNSAAGGASSGDSAGPATKEFDDSTFVFHIDIVLLCVFGLYVLFTLPRAFARICRTSELRAGHLLRSGGSHRIVPLPLGSAGDLQQVNASRPELDSELSHSYNSHAHLVSNLSASGKSRKYNPPPRVPRLSTLIHPFIGYALNYRVAPSMSVAKLFILAVYLGIVFYAAFYKSDPFSAPIRAGFVGMSQIPIVVALATKNNLLSYLSGTGYEKLNFIHRFGGRLIALGVNVHALGYIYQWSIAGTVMEEIKAPPILAGLVGLAGVDLLAFFSIQFVRQRFYNFFFISHIVGFFVFLIAAIIHFPVTIPYCAAAFAVYGFDHLLRAIKTRFATGTLVAIPALGSTVVSVPDLGHGWRAGQHVRLRVVSPSASSALGPFGYCWAWLVGRARPFTISTASGGDGGLQLIVKKKHGGWTGDLFDMAQVQDRVAEDKWMDTEKGVSTGGSREVRVMVEGPYGKSLVCFLQAWYESLTRAYDAGGPGYTLFASYSGALLVAGGSGITFVLSVLSDLLQKHEEGRSRLRVVQVVWSVADPSALTALLPTVVSFLQPRPSPYGSLQVRIAVHYTRAPPTGSLEALSSLPQPAGLNLCSGRANLSMSLAETADAVLLAQPMSYSRDDEGRFLPPSGIIVGVCGPVELGDEVGNAVGNMDWKKWREVGGVEAYEEVFGW
ncbi:hypothetical protein EW146_g795 [Bondarzewia mesenterica]|uniref:ferric-chelate reductase (NADPH) n=1 Tax=Bondarzewia mesenterica TaxID=1095465 RepID=A0A4S4M816_9AGAM|nr:hypothetical protein EW146_g795 [Bondarzewia mesenterica]